MKIMPSTINHILTITVFAEENLHDSQTVLNVQSTLYL